MWILVLIIAALIIPFLYILSVVPLVISIKFIGFNKNIDSCFSMYCIIGAIVYMDTFL